MVILGSCYKWVMLSYNSRVIGLCDMVKYQSCALSKVMASELVQQTRNQVVYTVTP